MAKEGKAAFGKDLFGLKKKKAERLKEPPTLYDFAQHGILNGDTAPQANWNWVNNTGTGFITIGGTSAATVHYEQPQQQTEDEKAKEKAKKEADEKTHITPKDLWETRHLNLENLGINCAPEYIDSTIKTLETKLKLMKGKGDSGSIGYGRQELESMITRVANRTKFKEFEHFFKDFAYTSNDLINASLKKHKNLRCKLATEFIPDFPADAIAAMEGYTDNTMRLCGQKPIFYVIADQKDFGEVMKKRDPILLAQSPYGFFWQILGAWDKEMILLEEL
jgi:hypothetical protein